MSRPSVFHFPDGIDSPDSVPWSAVIPTTATADTSSRLAYTLGALIPKRAISEGVVEASFASPSPLTVPFWNRAGKITKSRVPAGHREFAAGNRPAGRSRRLDWKSVKKALCSRKTCMLLKTFNCGMRYRHVCRVVASCRREAPPARLPPVRGKLRTAPEWACSTTRHFRSPL